jgi:CRP-like cAMP-binding protein
MARKVDLSSLRDEAAQLIERGKLDKAIELYDQLETAEPANPLWPKRIGEAHRRSNDNAAAITAFERAAEKYALAGFLVQAIAVCKLILQIDPEHSATQDRLAGWLPKPAPRPAPAKPAAPQQRAVIRVPPVAVKPPEQRLPRPAPPPPDDIDPETVPRSQPIPVIALREIDTQRDTQVPRASLEKRRAAIAMPPATEPPPTEDFEIELAKPSPTPKSRYQNRLDIADQPIELAGSGRKLGTSERSIEMELPPRAADLQLELEQRRHAARAARDGAGGVSEPSIEIVIEPEAPRAREPSLQIPIDIEEPVSRSKEASLQIPIDVDERSLEIPIEISSSKISPSDVDIPIEVSLPRIELAPGQGLDSIDLSTLIPGATPVLRDDGTHSGVNVLPLGESVALDIDDVDDVPTDRKPGAAARRALLTTPLFPEVPAKTLEKLIARMSLVELEPDEVLFREGETGRELFVISEGEVAVEVASGELARLGPSAFVGEIALVTDLPRSATIRAVTRVELLAIDRELIREAAGEHPEIVTVLLRFVRDRLLHRITRTSELFAPFSDDERAALSAKFELVEVVPDAVLINQGERSDGLYLMIAGKVEVWRDGHPPMAMLGSGDVFGELSLLAGGGSTANVRSVTRVLALRMPASTFQEVIMTHPQVLEYLGKLAESRTFFHLDMLV